MEIKIFVDWMGNQLDNSSNKNRTTNTLAHGEMVITSD